MLLCCAEVVSFVLKLPEPDYGDVSSLCLVQLISIDGSKGMDRVVVTQHGTTTINGYIVFSCNINGR